MFSTSDLTYLKSSIFKVVLQIFKVQLSIMSQKLQSQIT